MTAMVYELYGLSKEEIEIVEKNYNKKYYGIKRIYKADYHTNNRWGN